MRHQPRSDRDPRVLLAVVIVAAARLRVAVCSLALPSYETDRYHYLAEVTGISGSGIVTTDPPGHPLIIAAVARLAPAHAPQALLALNILLSTQRPSPWSP